MTRCGGDNHLLDNCFRLSRMFFQIICQSLAHSRVHSPDNLAVAQFGFGLSLELWLHHFHRNNGGKPLSEVIAADFHFHFFKHLGILGIFLQSTGQPPTETRQVSSPFDGIDIVHIRIDILVICRVVRHSDLHRHSLTLGSDMNHIVDKMLLIRVDITNELL